MILPAAVRAALGDGGAGGLLPARLVLETQAQGTCLRVPWFPVSVAPLAILAFPLGLETLWAT